MRPTHLTTKLTASAACVVAMAVVLSAAPARAADDDTPIDKKILRGLMEGLGLKRDGEAGINYQERAPLVIPPGKDLPPPEKGDIAVSNPAWPKDPDVARAREQARMERNRNVSDEREREQNPLRQDQLTPGRATAGKSPRSNGYDNYRAAQGDFQNPVAPSELGYKGGIFSNMFGGDKEEAARFTGEPARTSLTEPPPGYQTPSPDQPYGVGKAAAPKATDYVGTFGEAPR